MAMIVKTVPQLAHELRTNPDLVAEFKEDPLKAISRLPAPLQTDEWIYRIVVLALGVVAVLGVVGAILLSLMGAGIPEVLLALGSASVGALAGLLAPPPRESVG